MSEPQLQVAEIWRYPIKSFQGERLESAMIAEHGIEGDRAWCLVDVATGAHLTARREAQLLMAAAKIHDGEVVMTLPDGVQTSSGANDCDQVLSKWLGREVTLQAASPTQSGTFETQADETETGDWHQWTGPAGSFHDSGRTMTSLVSQTTLADWDRRRFRINLVCSGSGEEALVGQRVTIGGAAFDVTKQIDRCVVTTRPQAGFAGEPALERDLTVYRTINSERNSFLGVATLTAEPGVVSIGDKAKLGDL